MKDDVKEKVSKEKRRNKLNIKQHESGKAKNHLADQGLSKPIESTSTNEFSVKDGEIKKDTIQ